MKKIIFDGDPGIDDTLAILLALQSNELELLGITTVAGNVNVEKATRNVLSLLEYLSRTEIKVAKGNEKPLMRNYENAESVHGKDGLGNIYLPEPKLKSIPQSAAKFIVETVNKHPKLITLVATGPLTNVAEVIRIDSSFSKNISEIVIMGGAIEVPGNVTPYAEYNIWADAESAKIVLDSGIPITLVTLDVTMSFFLTLEHIAEIEKANTKISKLISKMIPFYIDFQKKHSGLDGCYIHDALTMAFTLCEKLVKTKAIGIEVITERNEYYGQTRPSSSKTLIKTSLEVDSKKFLDLFIEHMMKI